MLAFPPCLTYLLLFRLSAHAKVNVAEWAAQYS